MIEFTFQNDCYGYQIESAVGRVQRRDQSRPAVWEEVTTAWTMAAVEVEG